MNPSPSQISEYEKSQAAHYARQAEIAEENRKAIAALNARLVAEVQAAGLNISENERNRGSFVVSDAAGDVRYYFGTRFNSYLPALELRFERVRRANYGRGSLFRARTIENLRAVGDDDRWAAVAQAAKKALAAERQLAADTTERQAELAQQAADSRAADELAKAELATIKYVGSEYNYKRQQDGTYTMNTTLYGLTLAQIAAIAEIVGQK